MVLVCVINLIVIGGLVFLAVTKGLERALPFFTFMVVLVPTDSKIELPGLFDLTTQRVALITLAVLFLVLGERKGPDAKAFATPLKYLICTHIVWCIISTSDSIVPLASFKRMLSQIFEYYLIYYIFVRVASSKETINKILSAMVAAMTLACILGIPEERWHWTIMSWFPTSTVQLIVVQWGRGFRMHSTFVHPILFGGAIAIVIPLAFYLLTLAKGIGRKVYLWVCLMLMFMCIYKTMSRGPWLGLILASALLLVFGKGEIRKPLFGVCLLAVAVLVIRPGVWETLNETYHATQDTESPSGASYEYRYALLKVSTQALAKDFTREIWGYGMESFPDLHLRGPFKEWDNWAFVSCDSSWIEITVETGYVGVFILALLLIKPAVLTFRDFRKVPEPDNALSLTFFASMMAYYFMMTNVNMYSWGQNGYMLWMIIALSLAYGRLKRSESPPQGIEASQEKQLRPQMEVVSA